MEDIDRERPDPGDGFLDVLLLGGSALHDDWGHVGQELRYMLDWAGRRCAFGINLNTDLYGPRERLKMD